MSRLLQSVEEYQREYQKSIEDPKSFWSEKAESFVWHKKWQEIYAGDFSKAQVQWFVGGKLNITENCLDRHQKALSDKVALYWEPNNPSEEKKTITYKQLFESVGAFANALKSQGIQKGDRVCIYLPMIPEAIVAMLACARIGAVHSVVFGGFSSQALAGRIQDSSCRMVITANAAGRGSKTIPFKQIVDEAMETCPTIERVIVVKRLNIDVPMKKGRDIFWEDAIIGQPSDCSPEIMDSEDPLFVLYTSGSTGKPKGIVHSTAGYMVFVDNTFRDVFQYQRGQIYWCTADVGWITGHSYMVYGPLLNGATQVVFEGIPTYPDAGRFWEMIDRYKVNIFYTSPTAIRSLQALGDEWLKPHKFDSLKVLGSVGEPINEEAWNWYHEKIGKGKCPIVDTWWQTETGGMLISPIAGLTPMIPSFAMWPMTGVLPVILDENGKEVEGNPASGNLCIKHPWPSLGRTIYGNHQKFIETYFTRFPGYYFTGDGCLRDEKGNYRVIGRTDDVIKVSGHRLGTGEVENAINSHEAVVESAAVSYPHPIKGEGIYAFVTCYDGVKQDDVLKSAIREHVVKEIGPLARPEHVMFVKALPKTRSGKIMRRILRNIITGETANLGDTSTLVNPEVVDDIRKSFPIQKL